jgi:hypothetical protein
MEVSGDSSGFRVWRGLIANINDEKENKNSQTNIEQLKRVLAKVWLSRN